MNLSWFEKDETENPAYSDEEDDSDGESEGELTFNELCKLFNNTQNLRLIEINNIDPLI